LRQIGRTDVIPVRDGRMHPSVYLLEDRPHILSQSTAFLQTR
jgi:hypothetical protein